MGTERIRAWQPAPESTTGGLGIVLISVHHPGRTGLPSIRLLMQRVATSTKSRAVALIGEPTNSE
jgi:hypothetical protein